MRRLCPQEYADLMGVHISTIYRMVKKGQLPYEQPAGKGGRIFLKDSPAE